MPLSLSPTPTTDASRRVIAARLIELAQAHGVTLSKNADLSALLTALQIAEPLPVAALAVVADVLFTILSANPASFADQESTS